MKVIDITLESYLCVLYQLSMFLAFFGKPGDFADISVFTRFSCVIYVEVLIPDFGDIHDILFK